MRPTVLLLAFALLSVGAVSAPARTAPEDGGARLTRVDDGLTPAGGEGAHDRAEKPADGFGDESAASEPSPAERRAALCGLLMGAADEHDVPADFFIRLIWTESRFDPNAVSPVGAQGIAQFMPYTARAWDLDDPFEPKAALPASASLLRWLADRFEGHWGLAAMAYNAGPDRVSGYLGGGFLPDETRNYVYAITGRSAEHWRFRHERTLELASLDLTLNPHPPVHLPPSWADKPDDPPVVATGPAPETVAALDTGPHPGLPVPPPPVPAARPDDVADRPVDCEALVVALGQMRTTPRPPGGGGWSPWGAQVAGHASQAIAMRQFARTRQKLPGDLRDQAPVVIAKRVPGRGRRAIHAVQLGAASRSDAQGLCRRISAAGAPCVVVRN